MKVSGYWMPAFAHGTSGRDNRADPQHQIGQTSAASMEPAALRRRPSEPAGRLCRQRRNLGGQPFRCEIGLVEADRAARIHQHAGVGALVLVERMRQRDEDAGPADRRKLGDGGGAGARDDEMARRHARRQSLKNGATSQATCSLA